MALANGVLVHGPTAWACAIRPPDGGSRSRPRRKRFRASGVTNPLLRGPARLAEAFALLPQVRRRLPERELPVRAARACCGDDRRRGGHAARARLAAACRPAAQELVAGDRVARAGRCSRCAAPSSPPTTAPSTSRSAPTSTARRATKEHERCGSHLIGPLLGDARDRQRPRRPRAGAVPARRARPRARSARSPPSTEIFAWMVRNPEHPLAKALAKPGPRAPAPARDRRADAGAARGRRGRARRLPRARAWRLEHPDEAAAPARGLRPPGREDAGGLLHRRVLQPHALGAARRRPPPARRDAGLPEERTRSSAAWTRRSRSSSSARTTGRS